jgi:hypothetical protein
MDSDLSINEIVTRCRHYWWLAVMLAISGLLVGFLAATTPRYQSVITVWSIPVVVRDQPLSRVDEGYSEALYASMLTWLQGEWHTNVGGQAIDVTVRLNRQTYHLMAEGSTSGFGEEATHTFENFLAWIAGETVAGPSGEDGSDDCLTDIDNDALGLCLTEGHEDLPDEEQMIVPANSLSELVWVGEMSGPVLKQKYPHIQLIAPMVSMVIGLLFFFSVILVDVSRRKLVIRT